MTFEFKCASCGELHQGMPALHVAAPASYEAIPEAEREERCALGTDNCVIDGKWFFIHGCLEIPVLGQAQPFVWGVWVSLSEASYDAYASSFGKERRAHLGPYFGWLNSRLPTYPDTANLKTNVRLRDNLLRPLIELEPTDHPLAVEQRNGITAERLAEIYAVAMHGRD
jgi:hypothetical protein